MVQKFIQHIMCCEEGGGGGGGGQRWDEVMGQGQQVAIALLPESIVIQGLASNFCSPLVFRA